MKTKYVFNLFGVLTIVLVSITTILVIFGLYVLYMGTGKLVGGHAYNLIIYACRGTGIICVGIASALLANLCFRYSIIKEQKIQTDKKEP